MGPPPRIKSRDGSSVTDQRFSEVSGPISWRPGIGGKAAGLWLLGSRLYVGGGGWSSYLDTVEVYAGYFS